MNIDIIELVRNEEVVRVSNGRFWTTTRDVAEAKRRRHGDVMRDVRKLRISKATLHEHFSGGQYLDVRGGRRSLYLMTRAGLEMLLEDVPAPGKNRAHPTLNGGGFVVESEISEIPQEEFALDELKPAPVVTGQQDTDLPPVGPTVGYLSFEVGKPVVRPARTDNKTAPTQIGSLVPLKSTQLADGIVPTVNARELHSFLELGRDFSTWIKGRIEKYGFVEGQDYTIVDFNVPPNGGSFESRTYARDRVEYHITLDMAKELSMVERNEKGKQARRYFIECERKLLQHPALRTDTPKGPGPADLVKAYGEAEAIVSAALSAARSLGADDVAAKRFAAGEALRITGVDLTITLSEPRLPVPKSDDDDLLTPGRLGDLVGKSAIAINKALALAGLQVKAGSKRWSVTEKGKAYAVVKPYRSPGGYTVAFPQVHWRRSVLKELILSAAA